VIEGVQRLSFLFAFPSQVMSKLEPSLLSLLGGQASIDWCEPNYVVSFPFFHVAEFANTVTSLFMALVGFYALWWKRKQGRETRYLLLEGIVIVVGERGYRFFLLFFFL
jgi:hypothetical protein